MSSMLLEAAQNILHKVKQLSDQNAFKVTSLRSWKGILAILIAGWVASNLVIIYLADFWYCLNFRPPWTDADYPPLCSDSVKVLPWMNPEYPILRAPDSNIRLLRVHPSHKLWGIETTLECASFLEQPQYRALSYHWGDSKKTKPITVNGKKMLVTENLWKALYHIRDRNRNQTLWVDAISINQNDAAEKAIQVSLMSFIFARAKEVTVWLGDHTAPRWVQQSTGSQWQGKWAVNKATDNWPVTEQWLSILTQEEYWKRCWIVQEIAMASTIRIYSRSSAIPWPDFMKLVRLFETKVPSDRQAAHRVIKLDLLRQAKYKDGNSYSLERLLDEFKDCFSTLKLDKVYAFIGMASDCVETCIKVDYSLSPLEIYYELMTFWTTRCFRTADEAISTVRFAGLVRAILSREYASVPKMHNRQAIGESTDSLLYFVCGEDRKEFCDLVPKLRSLLSYFDLVSRISQRFILYLFPRKIGQQSIWLPTPPEDARIWNDKSSLHSERILMRVVGSIAGTVCDLGPTYREYIERPDTPRRWAVHLGNIWGLACNETSMRSTKAINERLSMLLGPAADYRMRNFVTLDTNVPTSFHFSRLFIAFGPEREVILGLAPWETLPGDKIVTFYNTDVAMIVRHGRNGEIVLVGRAGIVREGDITKWHVPNDKTAFSLSTDLSFNHFVTISMLTRLSFDTVCLPGTSSLREEEFPRLPMRSWMSHGIDTADLESFGVGDGYINTWETSAMKQIDNLETTDLMKACLETPCRLYTTRHGE